MAVLSESDISMTAYEAAHDAMAGHGYENWERDFGRAKVAAENMVRRGYGWSEPYRAACRAIGRPSWCFRCKTYEARCKCEHLDPR